MKPVVAIVGRPNVGKSSLFNAIIGTRRALVEDQPGITRDRNYGDVEHGGITFSLVDTGGFFIEDDDDAITKQVRRQVELAVEEANAVIAVLDGKEGLNPHDRELVRYLRKSGKPVLYAVNKVDHLSHEGRVHEFARLGVEPLLPVSAEHGRGVLELMDALMGHLPAGDEPVPDADYAARIAILGRPNVGKSSLVNCLTGADRVLVSDIPGTTRDAIDSIVTVDGKRYLFVDTAGMRKKARISLRIEKFSVMEAIRTLDRVDLALLVVDAYEGIGDQEQKIAELVRTNGKGCIIVMNKWDTVEKTGKTDEFYREMIHRKLPFVDYAPVLFLSAKTGRGVRSLYPAIGKVSTAMRHRVTTGVLNRIVRDLIEGHPLPIYNNKRIRLYYGTQQDTNPPFFVFFSNHPAKVPESTVRYIENRLREAGSFDGAPVRIVIRKKENPYDRKAR